VISAIQTSSSAIAERPRYGWVSYGQTRKTISLSSTTMT